MSIIIPDEATFTTWIATADAVFRDELHRPPALHLDPAGLASMLQIAASGGTAEDMVAAVRNSPEWHAIHDRPQSPVGTRAEIHGRLRSNGPRLFDDLGPWRWKMATAFDALRLIVAGEFDLLRAYCAWVQSIGGNGLRVFGNWQVTGLDFRQVPDYVGKVRSLLQLARDYGLRVEFCAVCDHRPEGLAAQQQFIDDCAGALSPHENAILTFGNEPYQNMENPEQIRLPNAPGLLMARGMCNPNDPNAVPYLPSAGFTVYQTVRSDDWMRKVGKDGYEIRNGFSDAFRGTHDATINTEMIGAAETYQPGRRSNRPQEFFMAGIAAAMFTSGATAHGDSETMQRCRIPGPIEADCAAMLFKGIDLVPLEAPTWFYCRPGLSPERMACESDPLDSLDEVRIHCMAGPTQAVTINYRYLLPGHDAWKPKGINGWHTVSQFGPYVLSER